MLIPMLHQFFRAQCPRGKPEGLGAKFDGTAQWLRAEPTPV